MARYRREITHPEQSLAKLADDAKRLRIEIQAMVKQRRRSDFRDLPVDRARPKKPR
jgi:hypothetical protein